MADRFSEADRIHRYLPELAGEEILSVFARALLGSDDRAVLEVGPDNSILISRSKKTLVDAAGNFAAPVGFNQLPPAVALPFVGANGGTPSTLSPTVSPLDGGTPSSVFIAGTVNGGRP